MSAGGAARGETIVVAPNVRHGFRNPSARPALLSAEIRPAGRMQSFLEEAAALSRAGKVTSRGRPAGPRAMLDVAAFAARYFDTTVVSAPHRRCNAQFFRCSVA